MSLEIILQSLVEKVNIKLDCDGCSIYLREFESSGYGLKDAGHQTSRYVLKESTTLKHLIGIDIFDCDKHNVNCGITRQVAFSKRPAVVEDVRTSPEWDNSRPCELSGEIIGSLLAIPVIINGEVQGVIRAVRSKTKKPFTTSDSLKLTGIVNVYEDDISYAISYEDFVSIGSSLSLEECCAKAVKLLQKITRSKGCSIFVLDEGNSLGSTKTYKCIQTTGLYNTDGEIANDFEYVFDINAPESRSFTEFVIKNKRHLFINDMYNEKEFEQYREKKLTRKVGRGQICEYKATNVQEPSGSSIYSPIFINKAGIPEGVIRVVKSRGECPINQLNKNIFTDLEKVNFISFVAILSQTFCNIKYLELLDKIASSTTKDDACKIVVKNISKILGNDGCSILLFDAKTGKLKFEATYGVLEDKVKKLPPYDIGEGWTGWVAKYQQTLMFNCSEEIETRYPDRNAPKHSMRFQECEVGGPTAAKFLCVPILKDYKAARKDHNSNLIGVIRLPRRKEQFDFTRRDQELLNAIAQGIGQRLLHFYYNDTLQNHKFMLEKLSSVDRKAPIISEKDILEVIYRYLTFLTHKTGLAVNRAIYFEYKDNILQGKLGIGPKNIVHAKSLEGEVYLNDDFPSLEDCYELFGELDQKDDIQKLVSGMQIDLSDNALKEILSNNIAIDIGTYGLIENNSAVFERIGMTNFFLIPLYNLRNGQRQDFYGAIIGDNVFDNMPIDDFKKEMLCLLGKQLIDVFNRKDNSNILLSNHVEQICTGLPEDISQLLIKIDHSIRITGSPDPILLSHLKEIISVKEQNVPV